MISAAVPDIITKKPKKFLTELSYTGLYVSYFIIHCIHTHIVIYNVEILISRFLSSS